MKNKYKKKRTIIALKGKDNPNYYELNKDWCIKILMENGCRPTIFRDKYGMDYTTVMKKIEFIRY